MSIREAILEQIEQRELPRKAVPARLSWGLNKPGEAPALFIKTMSSTERDVWEAGWSEYRQTVNKDQSSKDFNPYLLTHTLVDESGGLVFAEADVAKLAADNGKQIAALARLITKQNGIFESDIEELVKNSDAGPSA